MTPQFPLEKVARAIHAQYAKSSMGYAGPSTWEQMTEWEKEFGLGLARAALTALLVPDLIDELDEVADDAGDKSDHVRICDSRAEFQAEFRAAIQHILKGKTDE